jgi:hypothetical protein
MSDSIRRCPFCGADAELQSKRRYNLSPEKYRIIDTNVKCPIFPTTRWCERESDAIKAWNNREGETK